MKEKMKKKKKVRVKMKVKKKEKKVGIKNKANENIECKYEPYLLPVLKSRNSNLLRERMRTSGKRLPQNFTPFFALLCSVQLLQYLAFSSSSISCSNHV